MGHYKGDLLEILLETYQNATARLYCPLEALPKPGQYLHAYAPADELQAVPLSFFPAGRAEPAEKGHVTLPIWAQLPEDWQPGTQLELRGPLGRGFDLPARSHRVALAALGGSVGPLLPLVDIALERKAEVVLCSEMQPDALSLAVEMHGLNELRKVIAWADYLAVLTRIEEVDELSLTIGRLPKALSAQALVLSPMPCGGLGECGVCALATDKGPRFACADGPVFDLKSLVF